MSNLWQAFHWKFQKKNPSTGIRLCHDHGNGDGVKIGKILSYLVLTGHEEKITDKS